MKRTLITVKKSYVLSALAVAILTSMPMGTTPVQAEETPPAYTLMSQAPWEADAPTAMDGEEVDAQPATVSKPFRQMVDEAKTTYMEETPDLYTKGHDSQWAADHGNGMAPTPSTKSMMTYKKKSISTTASSSIVMPHHIRKLKPIAGYVPTKRPVTPDHTPWKEMRAFDRGGDLMFY
jgi:hypothetical protein